MGASVQYPIKMVQIELSQPLYAIEDLADYPHLRGLVCWHSYPFGYVDVPVVKGCCSVKAIQTAIEEQCQDRILNYLQQHTSVDETLPHLALEDLQTLPAPASDPLSHDITVSVVIATHSRPHDLRRCLTAITQQQTARIVEIVVVDNSNGQTNNGAVVSDFPDIRLIDEPRQGLSYARNAGILACQGDIVATIDDDVVVPEDWLEKLIRPFHRPDVMVVTGNVVPLELETEAQCLFENYGEGGLGHGFHPFEADRDWLDGFRWYAPQTWQLGNTANAAFRSTVFHHPQIGLMEETLGTGMPTGAGEDIYFFYKVLRAGYTLVYNPTAFIWHRHRRTLSALSRQLYYYSRGSVAYQLTTLRHYGDVRGLSTLLIGTPLWYGQRLWSRCFRGSVYPLRLIIHELLGHLSGLWSLWIASRRVNRLGRSQSASYPPTSFVKRA